METYYTATEASERLGMGIRSVREACARGELPAKRDRMAYLIAKRDLEAFAKRREGRRRSGRPASRPNSDNAQRRN